MQAIRRTFGAGLVGLAVAVHAATAAAQITLDGTAGPAKALAGPAFVIESGDGRTSGNNLFHSFGQFNVGSLESATFTGPGSVANVIGRVTGGSTSVIDGLVDTRSFMPAANFFLLNPSGVMVGPGAFLDVGGAVHLTTADYLRFGSGEVFCVAACPAGHGSAFSVAEPSAFGFLGPSAGRVAVDGSVIFQFDPVQSVSLVGGEVDVSSAFLAAPGSRVQIAAVGSAGEVTILELDVTSFSRLGPVRVTNSFIDVSGDRGGSVVIRAGTLHVDASQLLSVTFGDLDGAPVGIDVVATEAATFTNGSVVGTSTFGLGRGGDVLVRGGDVRVEGGSQIVATTTGLGAGGDLAIQAGQGHVVVDGAIVSTTTSAGAEGEDPSIVGGDAGDLSVAAGALTVSGGGAVGSGSGGSGATGNVTIDVDGTVMVSGHDAFGTPSGISIATQVRGPSGMLSIAASSLVVTDFAAVISSTLGTGSGADIVVDVDQLTLDARGTIQSLTAGNAPAGTLHVTARQAATLSGFDAGILSSSFGGLPAGDIILATGTLTLRDGAEIRSGNPSGDQGGSIFVTATGPITISGRSGISTQAFGADVGQVVVTAPSLSIDDGFISTATLGTGDAGPVSIDVGTLTLTRGGQIISSSEREAEGSGGTITILARDLLSISGRSSSPSGSAPFIDEATSGIFSTTSGAARAGDIDITAGSIEVRDGATITATSFGTETGRAGDIRIVFDERLVLDGASLATEARLADGGSISIASTGSLLYLRDGQITTSVQSGEGSGGNITIGSAAHPIDQLVLDGGGIHANAFGGPGGNISIFADVFLSSTPLETAVTASSALSTPGTIAIEANVTDVSGGITELPANLLEAVALLRASCAARLAGGKASSLVVAGREGVPLEPGGLLPSPLGVPSPGRTVFEPVSLPPLKLTLLDPRCGG